MRTVGYIPEAEWEKKEPLTTTPEDTSGAESVPTPGTPAGSGKKGNGKKEE